MCKIERQSIYRIKKRQYVFMGCIVVPWWLHKSRCAGYDTNYRRCTNKTGYGVGKLFCESHSAK